MMAHERLLAIGGPYAGQWLMIQTDAPGTEVVVHPNVPPTDATQLHTAPQLYEATYYVRFLWMVDGQERAFLAPEGWTNETVFLELLRGYAPPEAQPERGEYHG